jgi:hypothetical protein
MGSDLMCFLQDEETKELILLALQAKVSPTLDARTWQSALISLAPQFFYTMVVCIKPCISHLYSDVNSARAGGGWSRYAPVPYPNLDNYLTGILEMVLGPEVYMPITDTYCSNLRNRTRNQQPSASHTTRQSPRFLRIIATPDDQQCKRLQQEWKGGVAVLRWDIMKAYIGLTADLVKTTTGVVF